MRIVKSDIGMVSQHEHFERYQRQERLLQWKGSPPPQGLNGVLTATDKPVDRDRLQISMAARQAAADHKAAKAAQAQGETQQELQKISEEDRLKILLLEKVMGIRVDVSKYTPRDPNEVPVLRSEPEQVHGWGLEYDLHESYHEEERLSVEMGGVIKTADGKEIQFSMKVNMERSFHWERHVSVRAGDSRKPIDPLVINYDGTVADLSDRHYEFDLDADGVTEQIPWLKSGSGFLALDQNGNGTIDNGSELFGPQSGDGFADLAEHDEDGNGWIDEGDSVYSKLRIWTKDANGKDRLMALGQAGIGAIYVGSVEAAYTYTDGVNQAMGQNRAFGVYVRNNGQVGTVQQIDLVAK